MCVCKRDLEKVALRERGGGGKEGEGGLGMMVAAVELGGNASLE